MKKLLTILAFLMLILNISGCLVTEEEEGGDEFKLTCKIDGVTRTFYGGGFGLDTYDNTYNNFYDDKDNDDAYVYLKFPDPVTVGYSYDNTDADFEFEYYDASGESYSSEYGSADLVLTVTKWGTSDGKPISGTFSGTISSFGGVEKEITSGTFESELVE